jgi:hypothetical protein
VKPWLALLPLLAFTAQAQQAPEVPAVLFDIGLGSIYEFPSAGADENAVGTFPVKRLVSERLSLHRGRSLYFEPLTEDEAFPFREFVQASRDYPITSYRVRVFPVLPTDATTLAELRERNLAQQVSMIEWSLGNSGLGGGDAYNWAFDLCRVFEQELRIEPEVTDRVERHIYRCVFSSGERKLEVTSVLGQTIQLSLAKEVADRIEANVYRTIRRLELQENRRSFRASRP